MQRSLLVPLAIAIIALVAYWQRGPVMEFWRAGAQMVSEKVGAMKSPETPAGTPAPGEVGPSPSRTLVRATPAKPGSFFMLTRTKSETSSGIKAVNPGEEVRLLDRMADGRMKVAIGPATFIVGKNDVTDDPEAAQQAANHYHKQMVAP